MAQGRKRRLGHCCFWGWKVANPQNYKRDANGIRFEPGGIDTVHPLDALPPAKYGYLQNVRAYKQLQITDRATESAALISSLPTPIHSERLLNDTTPNGPVAGYVRVVGAAGTVYVNSTEVGSGYSGNPISLCPFRPNASVQPWMYTGDSSSAVTITTEYAINNTPVSFPCTGMTKIRSDGRIYKTGIAEPQVEPNVSTTSSTTSGIDNLPATTIPWTNVNGVNPDYDYGQTSTTDGTAPVVITGGGPELVYGATITLTVTGTATVNGVSHAPGDVGPATSGHPGAYIVSPKIVVGAFTDIAGNVVPPTGSEVLVFPIGAGTTLTVPANVAQLQVGIDSAGDTFSANSGSYTIHWSVTTNAIATVISTLGEVTAYVWGSQPGASAPYVGTGGGSPHSGPIAQYIWKNPNDTGSGTSRSITDPVPDVSPTNNSWAFDSTPENGTVPVNWNVLNPDGSIASTIPLFDPQLELAGYQDFNCCIVGTLFVPAPGSYTFTIQWKDDIMIGFGGGATAAVGSGSVGGHPAWASGPGVVGDFGQTISVVNSLPLQFVGILGKSTGSDGVQTNTFTMTFPGTGSYQIEIDWDYWDKTGRSIILTTPSTSPNSPTIPPLPIGVRSEVQYRYVYRSSLTGAISNPSPESPLQQTPVLANTVYSSYSVDPQVDKVDYYRIDSGLDNFTYVVTGPNDGLDGILASVTIGSSGVGTGMTPGTYVINATGGGGSGAQVSVLVSSPTLVSSATVVNPGSYYTSTPTIPTAAIGGAPPTLTAVLSFYNTPIVDEVSDTAAASNPILNFFNYEPFPVTDIPRRGVVNITGGVATWVSGDLFNTRCLPGTIVLVGSPTAQAYTTVTRPTSTTSITIAGVPDGTNVTYEVPEPILAAQPLPYLWGPTQNAAYMFAVGDKLNPGTLYFTEGNNPDSAPQTNQIPVTSPAEPLMNGCITAGLGMVFSSERRWLIYPTFTTALATVSGVAGSPFNLVLGSSERGLYIPTCICTDGGNVTFFRAKDGIYSCPFGGGDKFLCADIYNLFPREGVTPGPVTVAGFTVYPPDDTKGSAQKLAYANGYLYYDYEDTTATPRTLVFDEIGGGWSVDVGGKPFTVHALEEGPDTNTVMVGCTDGTVRTLGSGGAETATSVVVPGVQNAGDARAFKRVGDVFIKALVAASNPITVALYANQYAQALSGFSPTSLVGTGSLLPYIVDFTAGHGDDLIDVGLSLSWPTGAKNVLDLWQPDFISLPEATQDQPTDWDDGGYHGMKFVQGMILEADTFNVAKVVTVERSDDLSVFTPNESPITYNGQSTKPLTFSPPFLAHSMRIVTTDGVPWRKWGVQWVYQPFPEETVEWQSEFTSHGMPGWQHIREMNIAYQSTTTLTLTLSFDQWPQITLTVPSSGGVQTKWKTPIPANKYKLISYGLTSTEPFYLFEGQCEAKVKPWGSTGPYSIITPFGGPEKLGAEV